MRDYLVLGLGLLAIGLGVGCESSEPKADEPKTPGRASPPPNRSNSSPPPDSDRDDDGFDRDASGEEPDCNDNVERVHPGAEESCDNLDEDCDGKVDEGAGSGCMLSCAAQEPCEKPVAIATGSAHTCALTDAGSVYCWGSNSAGQLGTPDIALIARPLRVTAIQDARAITSSDDFTCVLDGDGESAICWGAGVKMPFAVALPADTEEIRAGDDVLCARTADGLLHCRGFLTTDPNPFLILRDELAAEVHVSAFEIKGRLLCATPTAGGLLCWPRVLDPNLTQQASGQPRNPTRVRTASPATFAVGSNGQVCSVADGQLLCRTELEAADGAIAGNGSAVQLAIGTRYACARGADGRVACWAGAAAGTFEGLTDLRAGAEHVCALRAGGEIVCFGHRNNGALGDNRLDGTTADTPQPIMPGYPLPLSDASVLLRSTPLGACDNSADLAVLRGRPGTTHARVAECASTCTSTLDQNACLTMCLSTTRVSAPCLSCFQSFATCTGDGCYEQFATCAGYRVDYVATHAEAPISDKCVNGDGCLAGLPYGSACSAMNNDCLNGHCRMFPYGARALVCQASDGTSCTPGDSHCACDGNNAFCGACNDNYVIASAPGFDRGRCYRNCTTQDLCTVSDSCRNFRDSEKRYCY